MYDPNQGSWIAQAKSRADSLQQAKQNSLQHKVFSHIVDDEGHQYIDLVMEGGGMLGIALVGYTYVLEQQNLRFRKVAGTSAGAINALMTVALDEPSKPKSDKVLGILDNTQFDSFMDGPDHVKHVIRKALNKDSLGSYFWSMRKLYKSYQYLSFTKGLNPGDSFKLWAEQILNDHGIDSVTALNARANRFPPLYLKTSHDLDRIPATEAAKGEVALIATDVTTESRAVFPKDALLYWHNSDTVHPAQFVRASMSVPVFFEPFEVIDVPRWEQALTNWQQLRNIKPEQFKNGQPPARVAFVDGGMVSNFPFDIFHIPKSVKTAPRAPTFGVKLEDDVYQHSTNSLMQYLGAILNTSRRMFDNHLRVAHSDDYDALVTNIPIDEDIQWLNFEMPDEHKYRLFMAGVETALAFLEQFEFNDYLKNVRQPLS